MSWEFGLRSCTDTATNAATAAENKPVFDLGLMCVTVPYQNDDYSQRSRSHLRPLSNYPSSSYPLHQPSASTSRRVVRTHRRSPILLEMGSFALTGVGSLYRVSVRSIRPWW